MTEALSMDGPAQSSADGLMPALNAAQAEPGIEELAKRSRDGCRDSFEALVAHFEKRIFHYIWQMTHNQHDAEDLTQVTFLKAYRNIHKYQPNRAFHAWLFTIAKRTTLNHFRDSRPVEELDPNLEANTNHPSSIIERDEACSFLWKRARALKPDQYEALWLRYGEGFSIAETARVMNTNGLRVRVLLHRGRAALAKSMRRSRDAFLG